MNYIATKSFCFAGDQYTAGMVFDPTKYPHVCTVRKLQSLLSGRFIKEDFKLPNWTAPKSAPAPEAAHAHTSAQDGSGDAKKEKPMRTKGTE